MCVLESYGSQSSSNNGTVVRRMQSKNLFVKLVEGAMIARGFR